MERLDKIISNQTNYTRKEVKELIKKKSINVNGKIISKSNLKIEPEKDIIMINNEIIKYQKFLYFILNKPKGYISSTNDQTLPTVLELLPKEYQNRNLFPAGRLDKDTTGLILITNDGTFAHNILSPKKHVSKTYKVVIDIPITKEMIEGFETGINLNDGKCKPAKLIKKDTNTGIVTLTEGRYHQIKRMFGCFNATVLELERISIGNLKLTKDLKEGEFKELSKLEIEKYFK